MSSKTTKKKEHIRVSVTELLATKVYHAVDDPIMDLRLLMMKKPFTKAELDDIDSRLFNLSRRQWKEIASILKIKNP